MESRQRKAPPQAPSKVVSPSHEGVVVFDIDQNWLIVASLVECESAVFSLPCQTGQRAPVGYFEFEYLKLDEPTSFVLILC
jgi:hypothetical protein